MQVKPEEVELVRRDYTANGGWETFLAYEDPRQDILVGLLRLRKVSGPAKERQPQLLGRCSIVRELHVYGTAVAVHARDSSKHQHQVGSESPEPDNRSPQAECTRVKSLWSLTPSCCLSILVPLHARIFCIQDMLLHVWARFASCR